MLPALALLAATVVALLLAWFMYFLTHSSELRLNDSDRVQMLDFVRLKHNETTARKDRRPDRPEPQQAPEVPPMAASSNAGGEILAVSAPSAGLDGLDIGRGGLGLGGYGEYLPIVKVAPVYPRRALERGITGQCLVSYTVTTSGTVRDVSVIEAYCDDPLFRRPSVEAALRFKYKPRVIDGTPVEVTDVYNMFHYEKQPGQEGGGR
ncbi:MAG TPA: protein TonB [Halieaceae bacterium]|nr:protein TonB [Halieaceae bacterium]